MTLWRALSRGLRVLIRREAADRHLADESPHYLDESTAAFEAGGLAPDDARRAARREVGNPPVVGEVVRAAGRENALEFGILGSVRHWVHPARASSASCSVRECL